MRILIINPNTSVEMTETIDSTAKYASPGTEITTVNPHNGPELIANAYHAALQTPKVVDLIEKNKANYDYFIIAYGYAPGLEDCRISTKNVIGIGEAAIMTAVAVAKRFFFLSSTEEPATAVPDKLRSLGIDQSRCASARPVGTSDEIVKMRNEMFEVYCQVSQKCVEEDGASALIFSCAGMSDIKEHLEQHLKIPVITGVMSVVKIAEQFSSIPHL